MSLRLLAGFSIFSMGSASGSAYFDTHPYDAAIPEQALLASTMISTGVEG